MALASAVENFAILACSTTATSAVLNPQKEYTLVHLGTDISGNSNDTENQATVFISTTSSFTPAHSEADKVFPLMAGQSTVVGPGISTIYADCTVTNADPVIGLSAGANQSGIF